jgi:hypothetical protein
MVAADSGRLTWAFEEALREWQGKEGEQSYWFIHTTGARPRDVACFLEFCVKWGVARTLTGDGKADVLHLLIQSYRPVWTALSAATVDSYRSVEQFAETARDRGWTPRSGTPTSFASKAAFMCNPAVFAPYDGFGRKALQSRGFRVHIGDYRAYMEAFSRTASELASTTTPLANALVARSTRPIDLRTAHMRIVDKFLMREGGFSA